MQPQKPELFKNLPKIIPQVVEVKIIKSVLNNFIFCGFMIQCLGLPESREPDMTKLWGPNSIPNPVPDFITLIKSRPIFALVNLRGRI